jgi:hypothetical protein
MDSCDSKEFKVIKIDNHYLSNKKMEVFTL